MGKKKKKLKDFEKRLEAVERQIGNSFELLKQIEEESKQHVTLIEEHKDAVTRLANLVEVSGVFTEVRTDIERLKADVKNLWTMNCNRISGNQRN